MLWSFNRISDQEKITTHNVEWEGPFSWPKFESTNGLPKMPDYEGIYVFAFDYNDGYLVSGVGITNSTRTRISSHNREFQKGNYTILDAGLIKKGIRSEIWHGWHYAKQNRNEFRENKETIMEALNIFLGEMKLFVAQQPSKRLRERTEAAIMHNIYVSKEPWSEIADRGMFLKERYNSEMPILTLNNSIKPIYGIPKELEI